MSIDISSGEEPQFEETQSAAAGVPFGHFCQHVFEMKNAAGAFTTRERGMYGIHYMNSTGGTLDTTWTTADFAAVESAQATLWGSIAGYIADGVRLVEHRWYAYGPEVVKPNPPSRVTVIGSPLVGSSAAAHVRQVATTVTFRTALRRHWGRIYFPIRASSYSSSGQLSSSDTDTLAAAFRTALLAAETSQGVVPVVYDRNRKLAMTISAIEIDSVPDVIRRRRPRDTGYKKVYTA